jgi:hypothetical protein
MENVVNNSDVDSDEENNESSDIYFTPVPDELSKPRRFQYTSQDLIAKTNLRRSLDFEASPSILHFTGFVVGKEYCLDLNIINCSAYKERMNIMPLNSNVFQVYLSTLSYPFAMSQLSSLTFLLHFHSWTIN